MKQVTSPKQRTSETGSAGVKLLIALTIIATVAFAGYNYIPTAYQGQSFKDDVETAVIRGYAMPASSGKPVDLVRERIYKAISKHEVPADTYVDVKMNKGKLTARIYYKKVVQILPFGLYDYEYIFDHTATPNGFLTQ